MFLSVLDAIFGGNLVGDDLRRVGRTLIDLDLLLGSEEKRRPILSLIPERKRTGLERRVGRKFSRLAHAIGPSRK